MKNMKTIPFVGRVSQLSRLDLLTKKKTASLVVVKGRRRIGKSRLIEQFSSKYKLLKFSGLAPDNHLTDQDQRNHFSFQLQQQTGLPEIKTDDWSKLFVLLSERTQKGRVIVFFDEITWMADQDPTFLSKLQSFWENYLSQNAQLIFVICGSVSAWIEKNILSSTAFYGRVTETITLQELSLPESNQLLNYVGFNKSSSYEKFKLLAITGGIPWYIEQISPEQTANNNIQRLCFSEDGLLVKEFKRIFADIFGRRSEVSQKIVAFLSKGAAEADEITKAVGYYSGGAMSDYLNELTDSGFIQREYTWQLKTGKEQKFSKYRLSDNYLRFYLKYIVPRLSKIKKGQLANINITSLPALETIMGLQFENLLLSNRALIFKALGISSDDIVNDNPYFQRKNTKQSGCQIDYLIQTKYNNLYVCEIKFSRNPIGKSIVGEMQQKIASINKPKHFAIIPVLIHVSGVDDRVVEQDYFGKIIDFADFLE